MNEDYLYKVEKEIIDFCASEDVKCTPVKDLSYEQPYHNTKTTYKTLCEGKFNIFYFKI
jgi:hypothetical protein